MDQSPNWIVLGLQFLSLFVPAVIAVFGSFWLYIKRTKRKRKALRTAIRTEIESAKKLEYIAKNIEQNRVSYSSAVASSIYDGHSFELGLLDDEVRKPIIEYYTNARILNDMLITIKELELSDQSVPVEDYEDIQWQLDRVRGLRKSALIHLNSDEVPEETEFD